MSAVSVLIVDDSVTVRAVLRIRLAGNTVGEIPLDPGRAEHEIVVDPVMAGIATTHRVDLALRVMNGTEGHVMVERVAWETL